MTSQAQAWEKAEKLARVMDACIEIPGTRLKIGLDSIVGLIPGAGDWVCGALSLYLFKLAVQQGVPGPILLRMGVNIIIDTLVGSIPVLGDAFDLYWKANLKNLRLLQSALADPGRLKSQSTLWIAGLLTVILLVLLAILVIPAILVITLW